jgi:hypothetical protein
MERGVGGIEFTEMGGRSSSQRSRAEEALESGPLGPKHELAGA